MSFFGRYPRKYGENWDKRVAAFLLAFRDEGYLFNPPHERETLEPYPVPRTWTWLALERFKWESISFFTHDKKN